MRQGALRIADASNAMEKCRTVGVLKVDMPSGFFRMRSPVTSVMTTNINPVSDAAAAPVIA